MKSTCQLSWDEYRQHTLSINMLATLLRLGVIQGLHIRKFSAYVGDKVLIEVRTNER